jgi:cytochrome b pre-mRNA-processing protein 3
MAKAFYGRLAAYEAAKDEKELAAALAKNLWRGASPDARARKLAAYAMTARRHLAASAPGALDFGPLPTI